MIMLVVIAKANVSALMQLPAQSCAVPERASNKQASSGVAETWNCESPRCIPNIQQLFPQTTSLVDANVPNPFLLRAQRLFDGLGLMFQHPVQT